MQLKQFEPIRDVSSLRVALCRNQKPLTDLWRIWTQGDEVYVSTRNASMMKVRASFHSSGKSFLWLNQQRLDLGPGMLLPSGNWIDALQIQFLTPTDAMPPKEFKRPKPSDKPLYLETPDGCTVFLDVLFGLGSTTVSTPIDCMPDVTRILFTRTLRSGRAVVVTARLSDMTPGDYEHLERLRHGIGLRVHHGQPVKKPAAELYEFNVSPAGGNLVFVLPLGPEAYPDGIQSS
jgi:hypothetical protein